MSIDIQRTKLGQPPSWLVLVGLIFIWQAICWIGRPSPFILPDPQSVAIALYEQPAMFATQAWHTALNTVAGFVLATIIGIVLALGIVYSKFLESTLFTTLIALNSVPKVALAPLFVIWMGTGNTSKIAMAFLIAVFAIVIDAVLGLRMMDNDMQQLGQSMRSSPLQVLWKLRLPNALPSLFAGMKVAVGLSLVGVLVGEFVSAQRGLGYVIMAAQGAFDTPRVFAAIMILSALGIILFHIVEMAERRLIPWHVSQRPASK